MKIIIGKLFLIILLINSNLLANVKAEVNNKYIDQGEAVLFTITAKGEQVSFPDITNISNFQITNSSRGTSTQIYNGERETEHTIIYQLIPNKSFTIPSYKINIDGNEFSTKSIDVIVKLPEISKEGDDFIITLESNKKEAYIGETIEFKAIFKRKINVNYDKIELISPKFEGFWKKGEEEGRHYQDNGYDIQSYSFLYSPQKSGEIEIPNISARLATVENSNNYSIYRSQKVTWKRVFSNKLNIKVKELPNDVKLYGEFYIKSEIDKQETEANKPVNLNITIVGTGNIEDIEKFKVNIKNTNSFSDEPMIKGEIKNKEYIGVFKQKIAFVSDIDFVIPSLKIKFLNQKTKKIDTIQTDSLKIKVKGSKERKIIKNTLETNSQKSIPIPKEANLSSNRNDKIIIYILSTIILLMFIYIINNKFKRKIRKTDELNDIIIEIKKTKNDKEILDTLIKENFSLKSPNISNIINKLEEKIYKKKDYIINKKEIIKLIIKEKSNESN